MVLKAILGTTTKSMEGRRNVSFTDDVIDKSEVEENKQESHRRGEEIFESPKHL